MIMQCIGAINDQITSFHFSMTEIKFFLQYDKSYAVNAMIKILKFPLHKMEYEKATPSKCVVSA